MFWYASNRWYFYGIPGYFLRSIVFEHTHTYRMCILHKTEVCGARIRIHFPNDKFGKLFLWRVSSRFFKILSARTIQRTPAVLAAVLAPRNRAWRGKKKKRWVLAMRRLIKSSGLWARTHTGTYIRHENSRAHINTHLHVACSSILGLLAAPRRTVSQRSSSASYHTPVSSLSL